MAAAYASDLSQYPTSISGDQIVQNIIQVGQSDGLDAVSLDHDFYGISQEGTVFSLASFRVVETGPNTNTGKLELHVYNSDGVSVPILTIGEEGATIEGSFNVKGESTSLATTSVVVEDKDMVLASGATMPSHLDKGGIILGTSDSGTKTMLYDIVSDNWSTNIGINIDPASAFTIGDTQTILNGTGLSVGEVSLTAGSLTLAPDVSLAATGLNMGEVSLTAAGSLSLAPDVSLDTQGLQIGDVSLTAGSLELASDISLKTGGLEIGDISITPLGGLIVGDPEGSDASNSVVVDKSGVNIGEHTSLQVETGLSLGSDVLLDQQGLHLKNTDAAVYLGETGWKIAYDSSSQHLAFEFYDANSNSYVTKAEIKS